MYMNTLFCRVTVVYRMRIGHFKFVACEYETLRPANSQRTTPCIITQKVLRTTGVQPSPRIIGISHRISDAPIRVSPSVKLVLNSITLFDQLANRIPTIIFDQFPVVASATTISIAETHIKIKTKTYSHHFISPYGSFSPVFTVATFIRICMGV